MAGSVGEWDEVLFWVPVSVTHSRHIKEYYCVYSMFPRPRPAGPASLSLANVQREEGRETKERAVITHQTQSSEPTVDGREESPFFTLCDTVVKTRRLQRTVTGYRDPRLALASCVNSVNHRLRLPFSGPNCAP